jgi:hypothetical protein
MKVQCTVETINQTISILHYEIKRENTSVLCPASSITLKEWYHHQPLRFRERSIFLGFKALTFLKSLSCTHVRIISGTFRCNISVYQFGNQITAE